MYRRRESHLKSRIGRILHPFASHAKRKRHDRFVCRFVPSEYETGFRCLAGILGLPKRDIPDGEFVGRLVRHRTNPAGSLSIADCLFAAAFVSIIRPRRMIEIGTGSGFSSALLAYAIHSQRPDVIAPCLETLDAHPEYFADRALPVGFEIANLIPELRDLVRVHAPRESTFVRELARTGEFTAAFIDANHQHPCALLDVLHIAACVESEGWILLHDIRLGSMLEAAHKKGISLDQQPFFGAEWLFDYWPWNKIDGGNIGAIQLPEERKALASFSQRLMRLPLEVCQQSYFRMRNEVREALQAFPA